MPHSSSHPRLYLCPTATQVARAQQGPADPTAAAPSQGSQSSEKGWSLMATVKELWSTLTRGIRPSLSRGPTLVTDHPGPKRTPDLRTVKLELMEAQRLMLRASVMLRRIHKELDLG